MTEGEGRWFVAAFPFLFIGLWLTITTVLGVLSGWFSLQGQFERGDECALLTLRVKSGSMGLGVSMSGILTLAACPSGLRVGIWRMFGPFQRPFLVPWAEIRAESKRVFFVPSTRLRLGLPEVGTLTIDTASWQRLAAFASGRAAAALKIEPVSRGEIGRALLLQWALVAIAAGSFFAIASRQQTASGPPLAVCFGFPALVFGIPQLMRWLRHGR